MSQELIYNVRFKPDKSDIVDIQKELTKLKGKARSTSAEESPKVINETTKAYKVQSDTLKALRQNVRNYQEALARVQKESREVGGATEQNISVQRALGERISETKSQIESASKGNLDYSTSLTASSENLREMKARLRAIKLAIDEVKDPLGTGAERVAELTHEAGELNKKLKSVDAEMGVFSRNVGNYSSANDGLVTTLRSGANAMAIFQGPLGPLAGRINSTATAISRFRQAQDMATISTGRLATAIKVGLISTGVGALVVALGSLLAFFRRTEKGQQALRVMTAGLTAVFQTLGDRTSALGEKLFNAFNNPKQVLSDLIDGVNNFRIALIDDLTRRVMGVPDIVMGVFGEITGTLSRFSGKIKLILADIPLIGGSVDIEKAERQIEESYDRIEQATQRLNKGMRAVFDAGFAKDLVAGVIDSTKELFSEIRKNVRDNMADQRAMNALLERERDILVRRARQDKEMAQAREMSRDLTIDHAKRMEVLVQARENEKNLLEEELALERERLRVMRSMDDRFDSREEHLMAVAEQEAAIFRMEEEHSKKLMSLTRDINSVDRQFREDQMRRARIRFDTFEAQAELEIEKEALKLERMGKMLEAEKLRQSRFEEDEEERKNLRLAQLQAEFENQRFEPAEAATLAFTQFQIEEAQRLFDAKKRLDELEVSAKVQQLQLISKMVSSFNQAFFNDNKALAAASAIVDTYSGIVAALGARPWGLQNFAYAATVGAQGIANVRKILATNLNTTSIDSSAGQVSAPTPSFGFVDLPGLGAEMASQQPPSANMQPNIILEGEFDPEFLSVKVRQGNDKISGNTIGIGI